jgi:crotonobetainyl-CoA:carnitine CoA-transferase CaiB-like acyl-CoA transferase
MKDVFSIPETLDLLQEDVDSNGKKWVGVKHCAFESKALKSKKLSSPPEYGEHTLDVLKNLLEIDEKTISILTQKGVIYGE